MKKLVVLLFCLVLVFSTVILTACDDVVSWINGGGETTDGGDEGEINPKKLNGKTPEQVYARAQQVLAESTTYECVTDQVITISADDETMTMNQSVLIRVNGNNSYLKTENDLSPAAEYESWYVDNVCYVFMSGYKYKMEISLEEYTQEYMGGDSTESTLLQIPEDSFADTIFEQDGDYYVIRFEFDEEVYNEILANMGLGEADIIGDVEYSVYFDAEGNLVKMHTDFSMDYMGYTAVCTSVTEFTLTDVVITAPDDADSFTWLEN